NDSNVLDDRFYSHFYARPMLAQVMLDAINQACGVSERLTAFPLTRTVELPVPAGNYFLDVFGQSHREYLTELDPKLEPNLVHTAFMRTLCRPPKAEETAAALKALQQSKSRDEWVQDLLWALVSSREFLFVS